MLMSLWHPCVCLMSAYLLFSRCCWILTLLEVFQSSAIGNIYSRWFFLCSVFLIICPVTATTTIPPVTVVCSRTSPITMTITMVPTSGLSNIRSPWCGSATTVDAKGYSKGFCLPCHCAAAATTWVLDASAGICQLCHGSSPCDFLSFRVEHPLIHYVICWCFSDVYFLLSGSSVAALFTNGTHLLGFVMLQSFIVYHWQAYVPPDDSLWPMSVVHWVTASSGEEVHATHSAVPQPFHLYDWAYSSMGSLCLPYMMGRGLIFQVVFHLMAQSTLNLCLVLNLMILVCWLGVGLMNLLAPGQWGSSLPNHTCTLVSQARCPF